MMNCTFIVPTKSLCRGGSISSARTRIVIQRQHRYRHQRQQKDKRQAIYTSRLINRDSKCLRSSLSVSRSISIRAISTSCPSTDTQNKTAGTATISGSLAITTVAAAAVLLGVEYNGRQNRRDTTETKITKGATMAAASATTTTMTTTDKIGYLSMIKPLFYHDRYNNNCEVRKTTTNNFRSPIFDNLIDKVNSLAAKNDNTDSNNNNNNAHTTSMEPLKGTTVKNKISHPQFHQPRNVMISRMRSVAGRGLHEKYKVDWKTVLGEGAYGSVHPARLALTGEKVSLFDFEFTNFHSIQILVFMQMNMCKRETETPPRRGIHKRKL